MLSRGKEQMCIRDRSEIEELGGQARLLMDDALLANNPKEQYLTLLESDIQDSKDKGKTKMCIRDRKNRES